MKRLKNELNALVNRGVDRHLRLAVTGLSRSGKTAFITAMVNQLLSIHAGARLPLLSAVREERLLGVKRIPQRDFGIPRFTYDEGLAQLYGDPPAWPTPTRGVSEIRLALRFKSNDSLLRHFKDTSTLYLEIVDYPGEWLLDLPMLAQDYLSWSRQMTGLLNGQRGEWSAKWRMMCEGLDPLAPADENRLADIAAAWTDYLHHCKQQGLHFIQPGRFVLPGDMAGAPALQFFPWPDVDASGESKLAQADKHTNAGMLRERFNYYCEKVVKGFYKNHFLRFDRQIVPGYNANPDETKYYGGVTAGGDSGLKNDGTTEWATGETGKTITESFMNKPKDILSPDAPFIQTGRDVVNRADSIVGNTGQQCSAQEISRSEYTNYTCERDLQVEQYCTRTARMELQGSTTWETRTLEYEMSQLPAREVNGQYVVSITSPVTGEIVDAHYSWSRTYLQKSVPMTITVLGTPLSWNAKYSADASFTPVQKTLTAGVAFTSSHPVRVGNTKFRRHTAMKLRLVVRVKKASYTPYVVWSESCPFSKELGKLTKTECTEAGGNRTLVKDGQSYSMYQSCWAYRDTYVTQSADKGTCQTYTDNPACTLVSHQCAFYSEEGACLHEYATYSCESKTSGKVMVCGGDVFCLDGECDKVQSGQSNDFAEAVSQLAALAAAGKDVAALNGVDVRAFTGQAKFCKKAAAGYSNCCKDSGWGQDIGLAKCSSDEKALAKAKSNKLTVSVGEFCSKKVLGVCLEKKRSYCQFDSKLAQIVQQQGRNGQLRISFGSAKHPDCRGITVDELQKIQFDRLDFTNFYEDLMNNQKIPDSGVLTQKVKEQIADQLKQAGQ